MLAMNGLSIKAIVVDIDGTLTDTQKNILTQGIDALREVQTKGVRVSLASGNVLPIAFGISTYLGLRGPVIAENGGVVSYKERIYQLNDGEKSEEAFRYLVSKLPVERLFTDNWRRTEVALKRSADLDAVRRYLKDWPVKVEATGFAIHIMEEKHSKMRGVEKAAELLGIDVGDIAAFGDSDNDVEMLSGCGFGVAVANATDAAKKAADYVSTQPFAYGVIESLKLIGIL
jgi:phosphoglycolate phosphatase (TIGR01487 family)